MAECANKPSELSFEGNLFKNWMQFKQRFEIYLNVSDKAKLTDKTKISLLLNLAGEKAIDVYYNQLKFENGNDKNNLVKVLKAFENYCNQGKNVVYERYVFFNLTQKEDQTFDSFLIELKTSANWCEFKEEENIIRDRIVCGVKDKTLQQQLLQVDQLDFATAVKLCRLFENNKNHNQVLHKKVHVILSKLTPQTFNASLQQLKSLKIDTCDGLQGVVDRVFEKALRESNTIVICANIVSEIALITVPVNEFESKFVNFQQLFIIRCQREFENKFEREKAFSKVVHDIEECTDPEKKKELQSILEEEDRRLRRESVGYIRFICELHKRNMLTDKIIMHYLQNLLANGSEESLECICILLSTMGEELEKRKLSLIHIFETLKDIADRKHRKISNRIRFMIQDVIDLRSNKWVPRRTNIRNTIDQFQQKVCDAQLKIQAINSILETSRKDDCHSSSSTEWRQRCNNDWSQNHGRQKTKNTNSKDDFNSSSSTNWRQRCNSVSSNDGSTQTLGSQKAKDRNSKDNSNSLSSIDLRQSCTNVSGNEGWTQTYGSQKTKDTNSKDDCYSSSSTDWGQRCNSVGGNDGATQTRGSRTLFIGQSDKLQNKPPQIDESLESSSTLNPHTAKGPNLERNYKHLSCEDVRGIQVIPQRSGLALSTGKAPQQQPSMHTMETRVSLNVAPRPSSSKVIPYLTPNQLKMKMKNIIDKYLSDCSTVEACEEDIRDNISHMRYSEFVAVGYNLVLERSTDARVKLSSFYAQLVKMNRFSLDNLCIGLENVFSQADDLAGDIPMIWNYLGEIIAPLLYDNVLPLKRLLTLCNILVNQDHEAILLASIFKLILTEKDPNFLAATLKSSELKLLDIMRSENVNVDFIKDHKLNRLRDLLFEEIHKKLLELLDSDNSYNDVVTWIHNNFFELAKENQFIRVLATGIFENSIVKNKLQVKTLRKHYNLLYYFVAEKTEYELQVLYALQAYINKLGVPDGIYLSVFATLYDDAVLSRDSFLIWKRSTDPAEQYGKGVALKQLANFFYNIRNVDIFSSSSEED